MKNNNLQPVWQARGEKGFAALIVIAIVALIVIVAGVSYFTAQQQPKKTETAGTTAEDKKLEDGTIVKPEDKAPEKKEEETMVKYTGTVLAGKSAPLLDFTKTDYDAAISSNKLVALYFYANWCPICKAEFPKMQEAFNELTTDKVVGFRVNYNDNQTDNDEKNLARNFGVNYQHTKVFLKDGQRILKALDSWDKNRYLSEINKDIAR